MNRDNVQLFTRNESQYCRSRYVDNKELSARPLLSIVCAINVNSTPARDLATVVCGQSAVCGLQKF